MARVDCYKERERDKREGSPIPVVELYDTSGAQVDVLSFLVPLFCPLFPCFFLFLSPSIFLFFFPIFLSFIYSILFQCYSLAN